MLSRLNLNYMLRRGLPYAPIRAARMYLYEYFYDFVELGLISLIAYIWRCLVLSGKHKIQIVYV